MKKLTKQEREFWKTFKKKKGDALPGCKLNQLNIHTNGCYEHEKAKFEIFWKLRAEGSKVITECWHVSDDNTWLRRDVVDITNEEIYEIEDETTKRGNRHPSNINVIWYKTKENTNKTKQIIYGDIEDCYKRERTNEGVKRTWKCLDCGTELEFNNSLHAHCSCYFTPLGFAHCPKCKKRYRSYCKLKDCPSNKEMLKAKRVPKA